MQIKIKRIRNIIEEKLLVQSSILESLFEEYNHLYSEKLLYYSKKTAHEKMLRIHRKRKEMKIQAKTIQNIMKRYVFFA